VRKFLISLSILTTILTGFAQTTTKGVVHGFVSTLNGDTMKFAKVFVDSSAFKTYTNKLGQFNLSLPEGVYSIKAISPNKEFSQTKKNVVVKAGDTTQLDFILNLQLNQGSTLVIEIKRAVKDDAAALSQEVITSDVAKTGVDKETIARTPNITQAAAKITGVSVVGGRYVYIRGLSDRYSKTILNEAEIPGLDPNRNSVQLDMFPSSFLSSMVVFKTYSPEYPADWAGGMLDIRTKEYPETTNNKPQIEVKVGSSYNSMSSLRSNVLSYEGGKTDFLGFDDGTRKLPKYIQDLRDNNQLSKLDQKPNKVNQEAYTQGIKSFNKTMDPTRITTPLNHNFSLTMGDKKQWFKNNDSTSLKNRRTLGYFVGLSYNRSFSYFNNGERGKYYLKAPIAEIGSLTPRRELNWERTQDNVMVGSLVNIKYVANQKNSIGFNYIHNHNGQKETSITTGFTDEDAAIVFRNEQLGYLFRGLNTIQFYGQHKLKNQTDIANFTNHKLKVDTSRGLKRLFYPLMDAPVVDWTAAYSRARQSEPDLRYITGDYSVNGTDTTFRFSSIYNAPARYFREMSEINLDHKINLSLPIELDSGRVLELKTGLSNLTKMRDFTENRFDLTTNGPYNGKMIDYLADKNIGYQDGEYKVGLLNLTNPKNNYTGFSNVAAGYLKIKAQLTSKLDFVGGARDEYTYISVLSQDKKLPEGKLVRNDILPSVNFNYALLDGIRHKDKLDSTISHNRILKLRTGYNRTLARPNFRELAPYATEDYDLGYVLIGNSKLDRTLIDNLDLKLEYFPRDIETFSVSFFYKKFTNPIELLVNIEAANDEFQWRQVPRADLLGTEIEFRKRLDFIARWLKDWTVGGNLSLVGSAIQIEEKELKNIRATDTQHPDTRPLFGQSPYLINGSIEYNPDSSKFGPAFKATRFGRFLGESNMAIDYNVFGERLVLVVSGGSPDVYERPFHSLNLSFSKKFSKRLSASFRVVNILNANVKQVYKFNSKEDIYKKFNKTSSVFSNNKNGVSYALSLSFKL
jgi:TonB-dependent receptor